MIVTELLNDGTLIKQYSDAGYVLLQNETGVKYSEAIDGVPCIYTYTETDELIESEEIVEVDENEATIEDYQDALREVGVNI